MRSLLCTLALAASCGPTEPGTEPPAPPGFEVALTGIPGGTLLSAWSVGDEVWFIGGDLANLVGTTGSIARLHPDTGRVCVEEHVVDRTLWWMHGTAADDWYVVGAEGRIVHEEGGVRTREDIPSDVTLYGIWATADAVWAVGGDTANTNRGEVWLRRDGVWSLVLTTERPLFKVWDGFVVGDGLAYRIEADDSLIDITPADKPPLVSLRGSGPNDVWAVGGLLTPELRHWDGSDWAAQPVDQFCGSSGLNGVWTEPGEDVWIAGGFGEMAVLRARVWECPERPLTLEHFHAVWKHGDTMYWAGGNLLEPGDNYGTIGRYGITGPQLSLGCE